MDNIINFKFGCPSEGGNTLYIGSDSYTLLYVPDESDVVEYGTATYKGNNSILNIEDSHPVSQQLCYSFLDVLTTIKESPRFPVTIKMYDFEYRPFDIVFNETTISFVCNGVTKTYEVSFEKFYTTFIQNVKDYSLYYAAPANYNIYFSQPFDMFVARMEKYRPKEKELLQKLNSLN